MGYLSVWQTLQHVQGLLSELYFERMVSEIVNTIFNRVLQHSIFLNKRIWIIRCFQTQCQLLKLTIRDMHFKTNLLHWFMREGELIFFWVVYIYISTTCRFSHSRCLRFTMGLGSHSIMHWKIWPFNASSLSPEKLNILGFLGPQWALGATVWTTCR